jgi:KUP system potassium uptake protein
MTNSSHHPSGPNSHPQAAHTPKKFWGLALGALGVVYGDLGTSPIYAFREAIHAIAGADGLQRAEVLGVVSLALWSLILIVSLKYVLLIMRMDNRGEGGNLALMALAQRAVGRRTPLLLVLGIFGASMFYGDAILTPAISVLSAVEGIKVAAPNFNEQLVVPITVVIILLLFAVQSRGTGRMGLWFGPILTLWFVALAVLGVANLRTDLGVLAAFNPVYAVDFLAAQGRQAVVVIGLIFLTVTGAEALYADMGHFGRRAIRFTWVALVFPALALNYLGQAALVLHNPDAIADPFFKMAPDWFIWPLVLLTMSATVIASQSIITGTFSLTQQAIQLGLLPRLEIRCTNREQRGQIYVPAINGLVLVGVLLLVVTFKSSGNLASAYGVAVVGAMIATTFLTVAVLRYGRGWSWLATIAVVLPFLLLESGFFAANLMKIMHGGWLPLMLGLGLMLLMQTWSRGRDILAEKMKKKAMPLTRLVKQLAEHPPLRVPGIAVYLTSESHLVPISLLHNLKHNHVLHEHNWIVSVVTTDLPYVPTAERAEVHRVSDDFISYNLRYGFMEMPDVPKTLRAIHKYETGEKLHMADVSFFLSRRTVMPSPQGGMPLWQDQLFVFLSRLARNPVDFFHISHEKTVEIGTQIVV